LDTEETGFRASVGPGRPGQGVKKMDGMNGALLFQIPVFFIAVGIVAVYAWYRHGAALPPRARALRNGGRHLRLPWATALIGVWFLLTTVSAWIVFLIGGFLSYVLLFWFGSAAAAIGLLALGLTLVSVPFVWAWAIFRPAVR